MLLSVLPVLVLFSSVSFQSGCKAAIFSINSILNNGFSYIMSVFSTDVEEQQRYQ